jgi:hypothetical protein
MNRSLAYSERTVRCDRVESGGQRGNAGLVGAREACAVIPAGVAFLQPFPLRIAHIATLPHRDQRHHHAEQCRRVGFRLSERIAPADRALRRSGCLAAIGRRVVGGPRWNRSGKQAQCEQAARQFPKIVEVQHDDISPIERERRLPQSSATGCCSPANSALSPLQPIWMPMQTRMNADNRTSTLTPTVPR